MSVLPVSRCGAQGKQAGTLEAAKKVSVVRRNVIFESLPPLHTHTHTPGTPAGFPSHSLALTMAFDRLMVAFVYQPRTRPLQPVLSSPFPFLSTVKSSPEEWFQITSTISTKSNTIGPIDCHVSPSQSVVRCSTFSNEILIIADFSYSFLPFKHLPCPIRFRSTSSSSGRPRRCRRSCTPPYRRIRN